MTPTVRRSLWHARRPAHHRAHHRARPIPADLLLPAPARRLPVPPARIAARAAALGVLALVAALPATGLTPRTEPAAADTRVVAATGQATEVLIRVQPWATRTPEAREAIAEREARRAAQPEWVRPTAGAIVSPFGYRWGRQHEGVDIDASYGAPVGAAAMGVVSFASTENGYGLIVQVTHADGIVTAYAHLSDMVVGVGDRVRPGDLVGHVGTSGNAQGAHLHFEVREGVTPIDPLSFLRARGMRI